jgi:hypothetical protein
MQCYQQLLPEFGITVKVVEEVDHVEVLDFCIRLMQIPKAHVMPENTFSITVIPDNCTVPNTRFNVQFGLRNQAITRHQPVCAVDHPVICILSAKHNFLFKRTAHTLTSTFYSTCHLTPSLLTKRNQVRASQKSRLQCDQYHTINCIHRRNG